VEIHRPLRLVRLRDLAHGVRTSNQSIGEATGNDGGHSYIAYSDQVVQLYRGGAADRKTTDAAAHAILR
jgi:hypothetical protein